MDDSLIDLASATCRFKLLSVVSNMSITATKLASLNNFVDNVMKEWERTIL